MKNKTKTKKKVRAARVKTPSGVKMAFKLTRKGWKQTKVTAMDANVAKRLVAIMDLAAILNEKFPEISADTRKALYTVLVQDPVFG